MKISIKLSYENLNLMIMKLSDDLPAIDEKSIAEKANRYLFNEVLMKLKKVELNRSTMVFKTVPFAVKFTYPEAAILFQYMQLISLTDPYTMAVILRIKNELHQKLSE